MKHWRALAALVPLAAISAMAHPISVSHGWLVIDRIRGRYELQMPSYEVPHIPEPKIALLDHVRFSNGGAEARTLSRSCRDDQGLHVYRCTADLEFVNGTDDLSVVCTLDRVTVASHVHFLHVERGARTELAVFDRSFPRARILLEGASGGSASLRHAWTGVTALLFHAGPLLFAAAFLIAAPAGRTRWIAAAALIAAQAAGALITRSAGWHGSAAWAEAIVALTAAYLGAEPLLVPHARKRWILAAAMGLAHGPYLERYGAGGGFGPALAGAILAELAVLVLFVWLAVQLRSHLPRFRWTRAGGAVVAVLGMIVFIARLRA